MATSVRSLVDALAAIVGRDAVRDDASALAAASVDGLTPRAVVRPRRQEAVAHVLALAHEEQLAVVPRGSGSALTLGAPPSRLDVVLDVTALDRVVEWNPEDLTVTVEAGATLGTLNETVLRAKRERLPIDPPGWRVRTIGGLIATNESGPLRARYGTMRDLLLGLRFVQADGVTTWGGARVVKSVTGYDVPKLLVGALGTVGVVVETTLRLHPVPESERSWLLTGPSLEMMQTCLDRVADSPLVPDRLEVCDTVALAASGVGDSKAALAVSFGSVANAVAEQGERLVSIAHRAGASATERPMDLWQEIERATTPAGGDIVLEIATLPARIAVTMRAVGREVDTLGGGVRCALTARGTVGTIQAVITGAAPATVAPTIARLREAVADVDGHVVVRRAPRELRAAVDPWGPVDADAFELMRRIRQEFDARGVLNPGRFVGRL